MVGSWTNKDTSLNLSFLIWKMGTKQHLSYRGLVSGCNGKKQRI